MSVGKRFFGLNSVIRDSDIILNKLESHELPGPITEHLHHIRAENLEQAMTVAQELARLQKPRLYKKKMQLDKHLQHKVNRRISNIQHFIPLIRDDEENVEELHSMRKQAKKLFYLLELENDPGVCPEMKKLKKLQTMAGDIHDSDIIISFLNNNDDLRDCAETLIRSEQLERHTCYEKLLAMLDKDLWNPLRHLVLTNC